MPNQYHSQEYEHITEAIDKLFEDSKMRQYIKSQFESIKQYQPKLMIMNKNNICFQCNFQSSNSQYHFSNRFQNQSQSIKFLIQIQKQFPLHHPKIYLKSHLTNPNISDCRDLFSQINQLQWNIHSHLKQCIQKIPHFLLNLSAIKKSIDLQKLGNFYLGKKYDYLFVSQFSSGSKYYAFETQQEYVKLFIIYLTQTHFLQFQPKQQPQFVDDKLKIPKQSDISEVQLIFMADIQCINQIQLNKEKNQVIINFFTIKAKYMEFVRNIAKKHLKIANLTKFVERILKFVVNIQSVQINLQKAKQHLQQQQAQLIREVLKHEQKIQHYLNKKTIQQLNDMYQQIVQFYSSNNNPYYLIYLHKISNLYQRKDVKLVLQVKQQHNQFKQK